MTAHIYVSMCQPSLTFIPPHPPSLSSSIQPCIHSPSTRLHRCVSRKVRVGYLSPDFNKHSVSYFAEALLRHHSAANFHVTCYNAGTKEDPTTRRLRSFAGALMSVL